jgi:hypothetical protein
MKKISLYRYQFNKNTVFTCESHLTLKLFKFLLQFEIIVEFVRARRQNIKIIR